MEEVALTMIRNNESDQKIISYTGLSIKVIQNLRTRWKEFDNK